MKNMNIGFCYRLAVIFCLLFVFTAKVPAQSAFWQQTRGPHGGSVERVFVHKPTGTVYAGAAPLIYRSADQGQIWTSFRPEPGVQAFTVGADQILFIGNGQGVYRSTDQGVSWTPQNGGDQVSVYALTSTPDGRVLAGGDGGVLLFSANNGDSWTTVHDGSLFDADVSGIVYAPGPNLFFAATGGDGVWKCDGNGANWTPANTGDLTGGDISAIHLISWSNTLLATEWVPTTLYRSTDYGQSWQAVEPNPHIGARAIDDNGTSAVFATDGFGGVQVSLDDGLNWTTEAAGLPVPCRALAASHSDNFVYAAGDDHTGLFRATGTTNLAWSQTGVPAPLVQALFCDAASGRVFAGTIDSLFVSANQGDSWTKQGQTSWEVNGVLRNGAYLFALTRYDGIFRSPDEGQTWAPTPYNPPGSFFYALANTSTGRLVAATSSGVFRSLNNGDSWASSSTGLGNFVESINFLAAADPADNDEYLFAAAGIIGGVFRSTNGGMNWSPFNTGFGDIPWIEALAASPDGAYLYVSTPEGLWRSATGAANWMLIDESLPYASTFTVLAVPAPGVLLVGFSAIWDPASSGLYLSEDNGQSWTPLEDGLTNLEVASLAVDNAGFLYAGTNGGGVFRSTQTLTTTHSPAQERILTVFPNPAADRLFVAGDFRAGAPWVVTDVFGKKQTVGAQTTADGLRLDLAGLPAGAYFFQMEGRRAAIFLKM